MGSTMCWVGYKTSANRNPPAGVVNPEMASMLLSKQLYYSMITITCTLPPSFCHLRQATFATRSIYKSSRARSARFMSTVKVNVYDLSHGLARVYAPMMLGISLDAIYHTLVVVYGKEYYIDQGVKTAPPGATKYGTPVEVIDMGETEIPEEIFDDYLDEHNDAGKYHPATYDLFDNNCNHFTDETLQFLVGQRLDDRILTLPQKVLSTPAGQQLRAMLGAQLY